MKKLIGSLCAIAIGTAGFFAIRALHPRQAPLPDEASSRNSSPEPPGEPQPIPIPETVITLKHALQWKDSASDPGLLLEAGTQLVSESTQGLDYVVSRNGRTFRVRCDDAYESHGRFTDGNVEQLALHMAAEIRAEGKAPTNERIVTRAMEALEQHRLDASFTDPASVVDNLQRVLLLQPSADLDAENPSPPTADQ